MTPANTLFNGQRIAARQTPYRFQPSPSFVSSNSTSDNAVSPLVLFVPVRGSWFAFASLSSSFSALSLSVSLRIASRFHTPSLPSPSSSSLSSSDPFQSPLSNIDLRVAYLAFLASSSAAFLSSLSFFHLA